MANLLEFNPVANIPGNWIPEERHTVSPASGNGYRFFKPSYGPFFNKDFELRHRKLDGSWQRLVPGLHYVLGYKYLDMTRHILQPVYTVVQLIDPNLSGEFECDYHSIGWEATDIVNQLVIEGALALLEPKKYTLEDIVGMPDYLPPVDHDVLTNEIFGWNKVVDAMWALIHVIGGDPYLEHNHSMESITGLIEVLDSKASADFSHKAGVHNAQRVVNHRGSVTLTLPRCTRVTSLRANVMVFVEGKPVPFTIHGEVVGSDQVTSPNQNWLSGEVIAGNELPFSSVSFTYDGAQRPVVYFGDDTLFKDCVFVLCDITYNLDYTVDKRTGYTFTREALMRATKRDVIRTDLSLEATINQRLNQKVDKTARINGKPINNGLDLTVTDILPVTTAVTLDADGNITEFTEDGIRHTVVYNEGVISRIESERETQTFVYQNEKLRRIEVSSPQLS